MPGPLPSDAMNALSRTLAVGVLMLAPGFGGYLADEYFGTSYLTAVGFILGMIAGITVLLAQAKLSEAQRKRGAGRASGDDSSDNS